MRKILLSIVSLVLVIGLFAAVGYAGYRIGYNQGTQATTSGNTLTLRPLGGFGPQRVPMHNFGYGFDRDFGRGFGPGRFPMMGFGFFSPLLFIAVLGLVIWFIYWLLTRNGWRLTRASQDTATTPPNTEGENPDSEANQ